MRLIGSWIGPGPRDKCKCYCPEIAGSSSRNNGGFSPCHGISHSFFRHCSSSFFGFSVCCFLRRWNGESAFTFGLFLFPQCNAIFRSIFRSINRHRITNRIDPKTEVISVSFAVRFLLPNTINEPVRATTRKRGEKGHSAIHIDAVLAIVLFALGK